ncbi:ATP-binding cassette domain-containing protein [Nonomuraea ferruginea]
MVGSTGAGKSTIAAIAAGILTPGSGSVRVGGAALPPGSLREHVAIITQEVHVFAGPLIEDLRLARPDASPEEAAAALAAVGALDWATDLPDGLGTVVGEGGHELTTAQVQQLALARLILADPRSPSSARPPPRPAASAPASWRSPPPRPPADAPP